MLAHHTWLQPAPRLACGVFDYDCTSDPPQFSWRAVAASAVAAGVTKGIGEALGDTTFNNAFGKAGGQFARDVTTRLASGTISQALTNKGGKVDFTRVAADAFGNALGNSIVGQLSQPSQQAQTLADNRSALNAVNRASDANYYAPSYNHWPDQTGAESARLAMYETRAGFIQAGVDTMGPESGIWGKQADFANEAMTQRSENLRDKAMAGLGADRQVKKQNDIAKARSNALTAAARNSPTAEEVRSYGPTYPALQSQISELDSLVRSGYMSRADADRALVNSARATSTRKSDYGGQPKITMSMSAWDGVVREAPIQAYLRKNGALGPGADRVENQVGPVIQPFLLSAFPGGQYALAMQGAHQLGTGYAQFQDGETALGTLNMVTGGMQVVGSGAVVMSRQSSAVQSAVGNVRAIPSSLGSKELGEIVGAGSFKNVYTISGRSDLVVALERAPNAETLGYVKKEIAALNELDRLGVPVVKNYGVVDVQGNPGIIMDRIDGAVSSKTLLEFGDLARVGQLNSQSIRDLTKIRDALVRNKIDADDFQVLISRSGRVVVNDPMGVRSGINTDTLAQIDQLINLARKNVKGP